MIHRPGFAAAMIIVMGLGIGATTAVFSLLDNLVLKSLPVPNPESLVFLEKPAFSYPIFQEVEARLRELLSGIFAWNIDRLSVQWLDELEPSDVLTASGQFYATLGVSAELGRVFAASDDRIGGGPSGLAAVISHDCWRRRFASDPAVVGRQVRVDRRMFTIIGVTPAGFFGVAAGLDPELTIPLTALSDDAALRSPSSSWLHIMARLADHVTLAQANGALPGSGGGARSDHEPGSARRSPCDVSRAEDGARLRAERILARAQPVRRAAVDASRPRRTAACGGRRERGESPSGPRRRPAARDGHASRDRREPGTSGAADAHRGVGMDDDRRRHRADRRLVGKRAAGGDDGDFGGSDRAGREPRLGESCHS